MKKAILFILLFLILLSGIIIFYFRENLNSFFENRFSTQTSSSWSLNKNKIISNEINSLTFSWVKNEKKKEIDPKKKIDILKKRFSLQWTILKWDFYLENNQPILAIAKYKQVLEKNPDDTKIIEKVWDIYASLKNYQKAWDYYLRIKDTKTFNKEKLILSLLYSKNLEEKIQIKELSDIIKELNISKEEKIYYINALNCLIDFHSCKKIYWDYVKQNEIKTQNFTNIKKAIENYENFQVENLYYKDALITWAFFENKLYPVSNILWKNLLKIKPWYKAILLIVWKGYYELWDFESAKKYLEEYNSMEPNNNKVQYMLWIINYELKDYITSNLYFNSALKNWYMPKIDLERRLIYNYYLLNDKRAMLSVFKYLLDEEDATIDDFSLWIYHSILEWKSLTSINWCKKWIEKFPQEEIFYWYLWWIYREENELDKSEEYLNKWLKINPKNPLINLNKWYLEEIKENYVSALIYFKKTVAVNLNWEFWELAKKEISSIKEYLNILNNNKNIKK